MESGGTDSASTDESIVVHLDSASRRFAEFKKLFEMNLELEI